ncbi:MAG: sigma-54-dependent transcriptional regulator [Candidatus Methylomirabilales bacterium]
MIVSGPEAWTGVKGMAKERILIVDDEAPARHGLQELVTGWGYRAEVAKDATEALEKAATFRPTAALVDLVMPGMDGLALLRALSQESPAPALIVLTGHASIETAVRAMKDGAYDYLTKPVDLERLQLLLAKAVEQYEAACEVRALRRQLEHGGRFGTLVGHTKTIREVYRLIEQVAPTTVPVLILGESGSGKELVARTIHDRSPRKRKPFVAVNCSAIPETLIESEIFGHEKGAFTGAVDRRLGCFELADAGTLFLDEVAEMAPAMQAKFLRVLEAGRFRRLGGRTEIQVDVRVLAATNADPKRAIREGRLREDLYYRLNVVTLELPPLRERRDDIPVLAQTFLDEVRSREGRPVRGMTDGVLERLMGYGWPGNVRELRNVVERAVVLCDGELVMPAHLPTHLRGGEAGVVGDVRITVGTTVDQAERALILRTLEFTNENKTRAAEILGISLKTLHNKLNRYRAE